MFGTCALCDILALGFGPLVFHFGDEVVGPSSVQPPIGGGGTPCVSLVQGWVKSSQDSRRLSYLSTLVAEGLGFATAIRSTSVSPRVSSVPLRIWTPSEALVCDVLCSSVSLVLLNTFLRS